MPLTPMCGCRPSGSTAPEPVATGHRVLIAGVPGSSADWTRAGFADTTSTDFAQNHGGMSPILVMPDANGPSMDSECANSHAGRQRRDVPHRVDVPTFMRNEFDAATGPHSLAVAGLSAGGTCAITLALRNPSVFPIFGDYSGYTSPTFGQNDDEQDTITALYGGSTGELRGAQPGSTCLAVEPVSVHLGVVRSGRSRTSRRRWSMGQQLQQAWPSPGAHLAQTCLLQRRTARHNFQFWEMAFQDSLPWLSWKARPHPRSPRLPSGARCSPPSG